MVVSGPSPTPLSVSDASAEDYDPVSPSRRVEKAAMAQEHASANTINTAHPAPFLFEHSPVDVWQPPSTCESGDTLVIVGISGWQGKLDLATMTESGSQSGTDRIVCCPKWTKPFNPRFRSRSLPLPPVSLSMLVGSGHRQKSAKRGVSQSP